MLWEVEYFRGGNCWYEEIKFLVLAPNEETAAEKAGKLLPKNSDWERVRPDVTRIGEIDVLRDGMQVHYDYSER